MLLNVIWQFRRRRGASLEGAFGPLQAPHPRRREAKLQLATATQRSLLRLRE